MSQPSADLDTFSRLDAVPWAQRAGHELRATGFTVGDRADSGPGSSTPQQQREIVGLAAAGLTNKQIGGPLFLSPRAVSTPSLAPARVPTVGLDAGAGDTPGGAGR